MRTYYWHGTSIRCIYRLEGSYFDQNWSGTSRRKEDRENRRGKRQTRPVAIQYASGKPKKNGTSLSHSTNIAPTITRKYVIMVIPRINIKRLTRMLCYCSYKNSNSKKIKSNNKNEKKMKSTKTDN